MDLPGASSDLYVHDVLRYFHKPVQCIDFAFQNRENIFEVCSVNNRVPNRGVELWSKVDTTRVFCLAQQPQFQEDFIAVLTDVIDQFDSVWACPGPTNTISAVLSATVADEVENIRQCPAYGTVMEYNSRISSSQIGAHQTDLI